MDFTSIKFPYFTEFLEEEGENHDDTVSEGVKSNVVGYEHPFLSLTTLKDTLNLQRNMANSNEKPIEKDIAKKVLTDVMQNCLKGKFPLEPLMVILDVVKKMDERSDAGDSNQIIEKVKQQVPELKNVLDRQPFNSEVLMAYMLGSASNVKKLIDIAKEKPYEQSKPIGSKYDKLIFYKNRMGKDVLRNNKEVLQFFSKRMQLGHDIFPHLPFRQGNKNV